VNEKVGYSDAQAVADVVKAKYPGGYSVLQIAEAFAWVKANIDYMADPGADHWQSAKETLDLGTGDCEDHALLVASIIGALGGSARVNLIEEHAFPTVFVASNYSELMKVKQALASYYGIDNASFNIAYLTDGYGYWLVIDTTGFPYVGGIPAKSEPTGTNGNWTVLSSFIHCIDATGVPSSDWVLGLF
jgi:transglutaminase-like putative cysteine protease